MSGRTARRRRKASLLEEYRSYAHICRGIRWAPDAGFLRTVYDVAVIDIYRKEEKLVVREVGSIEPDRTIMHPTPDAIKAQRLADLLWTETEDLRVQPIEWTRLGWFYETGVGQAFEPHRPATSTSRTNQRLAA